MASLVPRLFQEAVTEQALRSNVLVRADTGSGKTLIAVLALRQLAAAPLPARRTPPDDDPKRLIVFLTPTTTLVDQQARVIEAQTSLRVQSLVGSQGVDYWQREKWQQLLIHEADVVVLTPQIWLDVLRNAYFDLRDVQLVIFDEAHHAQKSHPYALIMRDHYHPLKARGEPVPRILGLTASPIWNVKNPQQAIRNLEATLDVRILEVAKAHRPEMAAASPRATELLVEHDPPVPQELSTPARHLSPEQLSIISSADKRTLDRLNKAQALFGSAGVDVFLYQLLEEHVGLSSLGAPLKPPVEPSSTALSPKMSALVSVLLEFKLEPTFHAIIFVQARHHASVLAELLRRVTSLQGFVRPAALVGHGGRGGPGEQGGATAKEIGMAVKEQNETVAAFKTSEINLLVATRVAEEGLDVPSCHLVIRFDALTTITGYVQSRGRARAANARYVVLAEKGSPDADKYRSYVKQERELLDMYAERPDEPDDSHEPDLDGLATYTTQSGALLTHASAVPLVAQYCQLLRTDIFTTLQNPEYVVEGFGTAWRSTLHVPRTPALLSNVFESLVMPSKKAAKQNASFQAAIALHKAGALDDHLLPVRESRGKDAKDADGRSIETQNMPGHLDVHLVHPFGDARVSESAFVHVVEVVRSSETTRLALVCGAPLHPVDVVKLYGRAGSAMSMRVVAVREHRWANALERSNLLDQLENLNRICARIVLNRRVDNERFYALWAPVAASGELDWSAVAAAFSPFDGSSTRRGDLVVAPSRRANVRIGSFDCVRDDVDTGSPTAQVEVDPPRRKRKVIEKYSHYPSFVQVCYDHSMPTNGPEPIIQLVPADFRPHNALVPPSRRVPTLYKDLASTRNYPESMILTTTLPASFFLDFSLVPSLNHLLLGRSSASALIDRFSLPPLDLALVEEALTAPSSACGWDYQRLEHVGDSPLKLFTTIHLYLENPLVDEGRLSRRRDNSVDNRFLRLRSLECGLAEHILSHTLRTSTFVPEESVNATVSDDGLTMTNKLSRRLLCDTAEAALGAALLDGNVSSTADANMPTIKLAVDAFDKALKTGDRLGLCFGGPTPWPDRPSARKLLDVAPQRAGPAFRQLEAALGYEVKTQGQLLVQALTHRSWVGQGSSYEREEFLGDALLDTWATTRLVERFPHAPPRILTFLRALLVSNGVISALAVRMLSLHKMVLHSSPALEAAMRDAAVKAEAFEWKEVADGELTFMWSPPKVLGDVFEALVAVVFLDSNMELAPVFAVLDKLYGDIMPSLRFEGVRDPYSTLLQFKDAQACSQLSIKVIRIEPSTSIVPTLPRGGAVAPSRFLATVTSHEQVVAKQESEAKAVARQMACRTALKVLEREGACGCREAARRDKEERAAAAAAAAAAEGAGEGEAAEERELGEDEEEEERQEDVPELEAEPEKDDELEEEEERELIGDEATSADAADPEPLLRVREY
ncbi:uncharacterized protein RHOBADRAFT_51848 [Rhodotorula graminis WP1]|uniref:Dicer-like protein 1 n=1 Tax=Rhodotorula graminis (strain WP1) TaxID=578459 RepID=A0A194S806_RHOGW|nr:uncharacterized protein RHOBADRAFT_51848 [Rhodotorula graminis WP1]KPV76863.1 hypothetical protein RHOBADRAFT_51848 [Rhodotorula graminis WP1]